MATPFKLTWDSKRILQEVKDYAQITVAIWLYGFFFFGFIFSHEITSGGLAGLASVITWATNIPYWIPYNAINVSLMIVAIIILGVKFTIRTIYGVAMMFASISVNGKFTPAFLPGDTALAVVVGSIGIGVCLGLVYTANGSTGGTDIVAMIINKYRSITIGRALMMLDAMIIGSSYFIFRDTDKLLYSIVMAIICNITVDFYLNGYRQSVQFFIISSKFDEISQHVLKEVNRGCTLLNGEGAYSHGEVKVIMIIAKKTESTMIFRIVKDIDPKAFITQSLVRGVYGNGFDVIKVNNKPKLKIKSPDGVPPRKNAPIVEIPKGTDAVPPVPSSMK